MVLVRFQRISLSELFLKKLHGAAGNEVDERGETVKDSKELTGL